MSQPKHPMEEDITFSDGTTVRITGLWAVEYRRNPTAVQKELEQLYQEIKIDDPS